MKAVILAAGKGQRFRSLYLPKPLTTLVNGKTILELQLSLLSEKISVDDIIIVVGYRKETILDLYPDYLYVYNSCFNEENTSKSLLRALKKIHDEDLLWINGDVVFKPSVLARVVKQKKNTIVVNESKVGSEEVKYRSDSKGKILEISKAVSDPQGEALGINLITKKDLETFKKALEECADNDFFEKAIELSIAQGVEFRGLVVDEKDCTEVDFPEDLKKANVIASE